MMTREGADDSLREVHTMKPIQPISYEVETWIAEEDLPSHAGLEIIRSSDPDTGLTEDEIMDRNEFIRWYILKQMELLLMIPVAPHDSDFFIHDCCVCDDGYSAFNTVDFQRTVSTFDRYGYAMQKIMDRVKDLALLHSSLMDHERRLDVYRRYEAFVAYEFRERLLDMVERHRITHDEGERFLLRKKIGEMNRRILECKKIWERYAPHERWDP